MSLDLLPFLLLLMAFLVRWIPAASMLWPYLLVAATLMATWLGMLGFYAVLAILIFTGLCFALRKAQLSEVPYSSGFKSILWLGTIFMALLLALHSVPGFRSLVLFESIRLSEMSEPYTIRYHFDKAVAGFLLLALLSERISSFKEWMESLKKLPVILLFTAVAVLLLGLTQGYLAYDPKISYFILWWGLGNLFITCVAEEAFFRLLIQKEIQTRLTSFRYGALLALGISSILFGLVHAAGGWVMVVGASIAGVGYGYAYLRTGRVEVAILAHFGVNLLHILLFTYPRSIGYATL